MASIIEASARRRLGLAYTNGHMAITALQPVKVMLGWPRIVRGSL